MVKIDIVPLFLYRIQRELLWDLSSHKFLLISNTGPLTPGIQSFGIHREEVWPGIEQKGGKINLKPQNAPSSNFKWPSTNYEDLSGV